MQKTRVRSLGREDALEKEMEIHSGTLAWKISWTEEPGGCSPWGRKESYMSELLSTHTQCLEEASVLLLMIHAIDSVSITENFRD